MKSTDQSTHYQICLEGVLDERWLHWFEGLEVKASADDQTILCGEFDQSALYGLFNHIRGLGVTLISVQRLRSVRTLDVSFSLQVRDSVCQFQDAEFESDYRSSVTTTHGRLCVAPEV